MTLGRNINANGGNVALVAAGNATEAGGIVTAAGLTIDAAGLMTFDGVNAVEMLSGTSGGVFRFVDANNLTVGTVPLVGDVGPQSGVSTAAGDVRIRAAGDLTLTENIAVGPANNVALVASGNAAESGGTVIAGGLVVDAGGSVLFNGANAIGKLAGIAGTSFQFLNSNAFTIGSLPQLADIAPQAGVTATSGNIELATKAGDLTVSADLGATNSGVLIEVGGGGSFTNTATIRAAGKGSAGDVVILADAMNLNPGSAINAGPTSAVVLGPFTAADTIALGAGNSNDTLGLTSAELGTVTAGLLQIGYPGEAGDTNILSPISLNTARVPNLALVTGGGISEAAGAGVTGTSPFGLALVAANSVALGGENQVDTLAGAVTNPGQSFSYRNDGRSLTIGALSFQQIGISIDGLTNFPTVSASGNMNLLAGITTAGGDVAVSTTNSGNLTLAANVNAGNGANNAALLAADDAMEAGGAVTASGLMVNAGGEVAFDTSANAVNFLTGNAASGSFRFLDADPLTIGTVGSAIGFTQSDLAAAQDIIIQTDSGTQATSPGGAALTITAEMTAGGNLLVTSRGSLMINGTVQLAAGKNIVLDANGPFAQQGGVLTIAADPPALVVDTADPAGNGAPAVLTTLLNSPLNGGSDTITNANVISALPPSGSGPPSNPISFADLEAPNSVALLVANSGAISGKINVAQLGISGTGGSSQLFGSVAGNSTMGAAQLATIFPATLSSYFFNSCLINPVGCAQFGAIDIVTARPEVIETIIAATAQPPQTQIDILLARPREFDLFTGRPQDDLDAPLINIFDEERLCEELRRKSPEVAREVCR